jgi:hypothetical protein
MRPREKGDGKDQILAEHPLHYDAFSARAAGVRPPIRSCIQALNALTALIRLLYNDPFQISKGSNDGFEGTTSKAH